MAYHPRQNASNLDSQLANISIPYQCRKASLSRGYWNSSIRMIEIVRQHGSASKCLMFMGSMVNGKLCLQPEEALFLMQCSLLQVSLNNSSSNNEQHDIPISLDEAYSIWIKNEPFLTLQHIHVYQYLTRIGFILLRHRQTESMMDVQESTTNSVKRKREDEEENVERLPPEDANENEDETISEDQRSWFPMYSDDRSTIITSARLRFPDRLLPVQIDWLPPHFASKVANVQLSIHQHAVPSFRPSHSLLRPIDLTSHASICRRLSSFSLHSHRTIRTERIPSYDMYMPRKHFRKTQRGLPDYYIRVVNGNDQVDFDEQYKTLTAVVHNGDVCFYAIKPFDPIQALQSR